MTHLAAESRFCFPSYFHFIQLFVICSCLHVLFFCCLILGRDYVMGFGRSLTIDLSLSRLVFLAWCLCVWPSGWEGETPRAENLLAPPTSFESESLIPGPKPLTLNLNLNPKLLSPSCTKCCRFEFAVLFEIHATS